MGAITAFGWVTASAAETALEPDAVVDVAELNDRITAIDARIEMQLKTVRTELERIHHMLHEEREHLGESRRDLDTILTGAE